jgi:threonine dehydrogenase-like Zn-dependent dehydrogenase
VKIKVYAAGLCGSDLHRFRDAQAFPEKSPPIVLGHEIAGQVIEVGSLVDKLRPGQKVVVSPLLWKQGQKIHNPHTAYGSIGKTQNGGFAEYVVVPKENLELMDERVSYVQGVFVDSLAVAIKCYEWLQPQGDVAIVGAGSLAFILARLIQYKGQKATVITNHVKDRDIMHDVSVELAANEQYNRFQYVVEAVGGNQRRSLDTAVNLCVPQGRLAILGVFPNEWSKGNSLGELFRKEISTRGINSYDRLNSNDHFTSALSILPEIRTDDLVAGTLSLEQFSAVINEIVCGQRTKPGKYICAPNTRSFKG